MDAFYLALLAALLAEIGGRTMLLTSLLAQRFDRPGAVLGGAALAAVANTAIAATGGALAASFVPHRGISLMLALALIGAGVGNLMRVRRPDAVEGWRFGAFATAAVAIFILEFGDGTMFLAFAFAAHDGAPALSAAGIAAGVVGATVPAVLLREFATTMRHVRLFASALLILAGGWTGLGALQVI